MRCSRLSLVILPCVVASCTSSAPGNRQHGSETVKGLSIESIEGSPGVLSMTATDITLEANPAVHPCDGSFGTEFRALADLDVLRQIEAGLQGVYGDDHVYLLELAAEMRDSGGALAGEMVSGFQVSGNELGLPVTSWEMHPVSAEWTGGTWATGSFRLASAGDYSYEADLTLLEVLVDSSGIESSSIVDRITVTTVITLPAPTTACEIWADLVDDISDTNGHVVLGTLDTKLRPTAVWRDGFVSRIFGNLGATTPTADGSMRAFLGDNSGVFGIIGSGPVDQLQHMSTLSLSSGAKAHIYRQTVSDGTTVLPVYRSRLVGRELNGTLYAIGGSFYRDLPQDISPAAISLGAAEAIANSHAASSGLGQNRSVVSSHAVAARDGGTYTTAAVVILTSDATANESETLEILVSTSDGSVLDTTWDGAPITKEGTFVAWDPNLILNYSGAWIGGNYGDEETVSFEVDSENPIRLREARVSSSRIDIPDDAEPTYPTTQANLTSPLPQEVSGIGALDRVKALLATYRQVQASFDSLGWMISGGVPGVSIEVETSETLVGSGRYDGSDTILVRTGWYPDADIGNNASFIGAHEAFHHLDEKSVDLCSGSGHMVPGALKEGFAEFAAQQTMLADIRSINNGADSVETGTAIICLLGLFSSGARRDCRLRQTTYKYPALLVTPRPVLPAQLVGVFPEPQWPYWPDCRRNQYATCRVVAPPSSMRNQYDWNDPYAPTQYTLVSMTLFDAAESVATSFGAFQGQVLGDLFAAEVERAVMEAFLMFDAEASFWDFRMEVGLSLALTAANVADSSAQIVATTAWNSFVRHGIDHELVHYCEFDGGDCR